MAKSSRRTDIESMPDNVPGRSLPFALALLLCIGVPASVLPPSPANYLTDHAGVLSTDGVAILNGKLAGYARETSKPLLVYVDHHLPAGMTLESFGTQALQHWRIGERTLDNGAILIVFLEGHKSRIAVSRGLRPSLSDAKAQRILKKIVAPRFKAEAYERGIDEGIQAMMDAAGHDAAIGTETTRSGTSAAVTTSTGGTVAAHDTAAVTESNAPQGPTAAADARSVGERGRVARAPQGTNGGRSGAGDEVVIGTVVALVIAFVVGLIVVLGQGRSAPGKTSSYTSVDDVA